MFISALALSFALSTAAQEPQSHRQAVTCTGVFLYTLVLTAQVVESDPTSENQETAQTAGQLLKAADAERLAAAAREGLSTDANGAALNAWLEANVDNPQAVIERELDGCIGAYVHAVM
ncbi:hypothetical protein [Brevundimonas sp.]|uniref:hypothetical protein n=1 Tax=Brevundimonas sp. TaxID=1871086 RepID=UPI001DFC9D33|nr:hypothetical protein [Brevundimonas sp.]MBL0947369.1 hypothetical protein [Brevundimonas sp.]